MDDNTFLISLYDDVMFMCKSLLVKRQDLADKYETSETIRNFERYLAIEKGEQYFFSYEYLEREILREVLPQHLWHKAEIDRNTIPLEYRDIIVSKHAEKYKNSYVEKNNYYRTINGLPDLEDTLNIYVNGIAEIPNNIPIHLLTDDQISMIISRGKLDELISKYPTKEYLNYLGPNKIGIIRSRLAKPFEILKISEPKNPTSKEIFTKEYYIARRYIMATTYDKESFLNNDLYDAMLGVIILCMAIRNTLSPDISAYMSYDDILNNILKSYGLDIYFASLPLTYKKKLIKNLDRILSYKGTDEVLLDICGIFSYNNITINRYYLLKTHVKNDQGDLIFPKKEDGSLDYDSMYRLDFLKVNIKDDNIDIQEENKIEYSSVVTKDPLWDLNEYDITRIKKEEFNMWMSKYISIEAAYNITELVYEINYFLNLLLDIRYTTGELKINNTYSGTGENDLFTMIIFLLSAISKKNGYDGNIVTNPLHIAQIYKFNLNTIKPTLESIIRKYKLNIPVDNLLLVQPTSMITNTDQIINMYIKNTNIYDYIINEINSTKDYNRFIGLNELRKILFSSTMTERIFTMTNGQVAKTYLEMLSDLDISLSNLIQDTEDSNELENIAMYILNRFQEFFNTDKLQFLFINTPDMHDKLIKVHLKQAVELFKASSVELDSIDIFFKLDNESSTIRLFDKKTKSKDQEIKDFNLMYDKIKINKTIVLRDKISISDNINII